MAKYKDSFQMNSESLEAGGQGILTAVENKDPDQVEVRAQAPKFDKPESTSNISPIRTLADDMQLAAASGKVSLAKQALKAQDRPPVSSETAPRQSERQTAANRAAARRF